MDDVCFNVIKCQLLVELLSSLFALHKYQNRWVQALKTENRENSFYNKNASTKKSVRDVYLDESCGSLVYNQANK